ncbi:biotin biosynthesis protein BioC [Allorhodopirellula heiligendammensis]|uniref:Biotin biosynthesis protein BioC n=1 Tax=Allorhodopirellula heiligendammensis TaxID=2714739 RepID=A0A5C6BYG0_9BACT|nr:class I SAM-dependent methyltransferase [Allorhodopirellula heiligendammensis]TWU16501.1 biotin biosynthesis protein BioC [Allorhodopirellula heiligendammensis]
MTADRETLLRANRQCYQQLTAADSPLCRIVSDEELQDPLHTVDGIGWLGGNIRGWNVLCLAAGGGRQSCLYAAAGAQVTVVDLSPAMLELDRQAAQRRRFNVRLIEGSMDDLSMLPRATFDLVVHPVSTCYLPDIGAVYAQVAAVTRPGGLYISQHKSPISLQASAHRRDGQFVLLHDYYRTDPVPAPEPSTAVSRRLREPGAVEFLHRWEELVGGMCRAGFTVEDLIEPKHATKDAAPHSFADRGAVIAPYVRIKARRRGGSSESRPSKQSEKSNLWIPS